MKVLVTGGIGNVGTAVLDRLINNGWDVRVVDRKLDHEVAGIEYRIADITRFEELRESMRGCQAVVHLAAIANPMFVPPHELFHINVQGTYNVYEAAAEEGIQRIVQASSINAFGCFWGNRDITLEYFPLDEKHPTGTTDVYSFSKEIIEDIGEYYWRRNGITSISLRFPGVWSHNRMSSDEAKAHRQHMREVLDEFMAESPARQQERLAAVRQRAVEFRAAGNMEYPNAQKGLPRHAEAGDPLWPIYTFDRFNFWAYVDERDAAQSIEKGLTAHYEGHHALFINATNNSLEYDSAALVKHFFPEAQLARPLHGTESLVSIDKARALIGFEPEHLI